MKQVKLCRICTKLIKDEKLIKLFKKTPNWIRKIEEITGVLLKNSKPLPQYICKICQADLETAYDFKERCIKAQQHFNSVDFVGPKCLAENFEIKDEVSQSIDVFNNVESFCKTELEIKDELPIEERNIAELCFVKTEARDALQEESGRSSSESKSSSNNSYNGIDEASDLNETKREPETAHKIKKQYRKRIKVPDKDPKKKTPKDPQEKLKKTSNRKTFICDQCGVSFSCKSKFLLDQRRHAGNKEFHCEICPEKYFLRSELERHVRKHTGEKPFPCRYCEKKYMDHSTRFRHERTHTNERPYACTLCSKAFISSFILKNHMVIHTGVRKFWCNLCDKYFGQKPHLVTHYKSMMHKQNEEKMQLNTSSLLTNDLDSIKNWSSIMHKD